MCSVYRSDRFFQLIAALSAVVAVTGCDSGGNTVSITSDQAANPLFMQQYDRSVSRAPKLQSTLENGNFDQPLGSLPGWSACVDDNALSQYIDTGSAISHVDVGPSECILQAVKVNPYDNNTLSCFLSVTDGSSWSGMAISYYDAAGNFLSESEVAVVTSSATRRKAVAAEAPANADAALAWFYTESGGRISDCEFQSTSEPAPAGRDYRKTLIVERQFLYNPNFNTFEGFAFSGFTELQNYPVYTSEKYLVDGFDSDYSGRGSLVTLGVTEDHLHVVVSIAKHYSPIGGLGGNPAALFTDSYPVAGDLWNDDSFEIYINAGNEAGSGYDANDFVRIYGYDRGAGYTPVTVTGINSQLNLTDEAICNVEGGINVISCEVRFSLDELGIKGRPIAEIGFDVHINSDDDGGDRDAKYSWCSGQTIEAWRDMSVVDCSLQIIQ
jgi:hypothetical protein